MKDLYHRRATLVRVVDGDTIDLEVDLGFHTFKHIRVRLENVDTWELRGEERNKGAAAAVFVVRWFARHNNDCILHSVKYKTGKYGRTIGKIYDPNLTECLNTELNKTEHVKQ